MQTSDSTTYVISGATGALGTKFVSTLPEHTRSDDQFILIGRSLNKLRQVLSDIPLHFRNRFRLFECELERDSNISSLSTSIGVLSKVVGIHAAADVSWSKSFDELYAPNIQATRNFAQLLSNISTDATIVYVSSAYTDRLRSSFNNEYERTKALADSILRSEFPHLRPTTFSCSLIIGDSRTGAITKFHGIYPLLRVALYYNPPLIIGNPSTLMDLVPVDWVANELSIHSVNADTKFDLVDVVATAGSSGLELEKVVHIAEIDIAKFRINHGHSYSHPTPIISNRRYQFLARSMTAWNPDSGSVKKFKRLQKVQRFLEYYNRYLQYGAALSPSGTTSESPSLEIILPKTVRYWLGHEAVRISDDSRPSPIRS